VSVVGARLGFEGTRTSLFYAAMEIVKRHNPRFVFLENVAGIKSMPGVWRPVLDELHESGYTSQWMTLSAAELGAPHVRRRWFLLATKDTFKTGIAQNAGPQTPWNSAAWPMRTGGRSWEADVPRMTADRSIVSRRRLKMLGNSCVPLQATVAFETLARRLNYPYDDRRRVPSSMPACGRATSSTMVEPLMPPDERAMQPPPLLLVPRPPDPSKPVPPQRTSPLVMEPVEIRHWSTPIAGLALHAGHHTGISRTLTERTRRDLAVQIRFEKDTEDAFELTMINPNYVEWLMGYPIDWTSY
jgi:hypothetical protein